MKNVISFPTPTAAAPRRKPARAKTLFLHVRRTTLIAHLAASRRDGPPTRALGESS